jgi:Carboxypeptidase regulatory-like domain/TonB-dependent Receptor Plug Domain
MYRRTAIFAFLLTAHIVGAESATLSVIVLDENFVAVPNARVTVQPNNSSPRRCETGFAGRCQFANLPPTTAAVHAEKEGFYAVTLAAVQVRTTASLDITLSHIQEVKEVVNVVESPPAIDPEKTQAQEQLTGMDIINIPYPTTNDYRNVLNFIPGVQQDFSGQPHVAGAQTYQTLTLFDGFNVTQPSNGQLLIRIATDALRSVHVESSRYSAEYGKGSGGVLDLNTGTGDDHFRFLATDFIPSMQNKKGLAFNEFNPRFIFSGPLRRGKLWFFDAVDIDYLNTIIPELPSGADSDFSARLGNFLKLQLNATSRDIITGGFNYNYAHDPHYGLAPNNPQASTPGVNQPIDQASVKDQHYFSGGELLELGFEFNRYDLDEVPGGTQPYFLTPETTGGSYYLAAHTRASRWQLLSNLYLRPRKWHGQHDFKLGTDLDHLSYQADFFRSPITYLQQGQTSPPANGCFALIPSPCTRYSSFNGASLATTYNSETSAYAQDRWHLSNRGVVEFGLRYDWDQVVRHSLFSPRFTASYALDSSANTKLSAGAGIFYDATPMFLIARPQTGSRQDFFFSGTGAVIGPIVSTFAADTRTLEAPRFINWSVALERKLPASIYLKAEFIRKRGNHGFVYDLPNLTALNGNFVLQNTRQDHYDAFQIGARHALGSGHGLFASYMRSHSRSNQVLDFNIDNPQFSAQQAGPYPWDAPNRFLSWGLLPLLKGFDFAYSSELRSGFPFNVVNDQLQLVEPSGSRRFPTWFTLNTHIEKRFHAFGYYWAIRGGFNNVTGHRNFTYVNNDINAPNFLTFGNYEGRAFTGRIRFLGKK